MSLGTLQRYFYIFVITGVVLAGVFVWLGWDDDVDTSVDEVVDTTMFPETTRPVAAPGKRTVVSANGYAIIDDVTEQATDVYEGGVYVLQTTDNFSIIYYAHADQFLVSLLDGNNNSLARVAAEQSLRDAVGVSDRVLCSLAVDVVIPPYIDIMNAGSYGLSFCPGSVSLP